MAIEFNSEFYIQSKFNQLEATGQLEAFGLTDVASLATYFDENGVDAQAHYLSNGMAEGINPSPEFDTNAYLEAKLEQLQDEQYEGQYADWTVAQLAEYFESLGITALDHYNQYGINEGIEPQAPAEATEGETVDLTTGTDELTGNELDDTFNAVASALSSERTLNPDDSIDGGEGNDTLNVTLNSSFAGFNDDAGVQNVETLNLINNGTIARNFNAANISGVETINLEGGINLQNLEALGATIGIADTADNVSIGIAESAAEGSDDTLNLALSNVGSIDEDGDIEAATITADAGTEAVENLNLQVSGPSAVNLDGIAASNLTVTGDGTLVITDVADGLEALDASTAEGDINATITGADAASVTLGSGNDTLTAAAGDLTTNAVIDGGEGQNRLNLSSDTTTQYQMSNIQTLGLTATTGTATFSARDVQGLETLELGDAYGADTTVARLGAQDINLNVFGTAGNALTLDHSGVSVVDVTPEADAENTQIATTALTLTNSTALDLSVAEGSDYQGDITANKAQSLEIAVAGELNNTVTATNATSAVFNLQNADDASAVDLLANKLVNLEVTAAGDADFNGSTLNGLEALVVNTAGNFQTNAALGAINQIELSGSGAATINGSLGAAGQDEYGITVNSTGLNDGLTLGTIDTNGTNITVNAADVLGTVTLDAINARSGDVNVDLSNVGGTINVGTLAGANVTVDATGALGTVTYGAITASESVTLNGAELTGNTAVINATGDSFAAELNGGIQQDAFTVNLTDNTTKLKLTGDLDIQGSAENDSLTINVDQDNSATQTVNVAYNIAGVETLNFDMGDGDNDTVVLTAGSSLAGVETINVSDGTVDITAVEDFTGEEVSIASGIKMTAAQFAGLTSLDAATDSNIEISVNSDEEAQAVAQAFNDLTLVDGTEPRVRLNVSESVGTDALDTLETAADGKSSSVTTTTIDDSGNAGETVASGVLTVKEATDATKLGDVYSIVDEAATIQGLIDDGDTDGILAGATAITTNDDPNPLALNLTVQQQSDFNVATDYNIVDAATAIQAVIDDGDTDGVLAGAVEVTTNDDPTPLALDLTVQQQSDFNVTTGYNIVDAATAIQAVIDAGDTDGVLAGAVEVTTNDDPTPLALDLTVQQQSDFNVTTGYNIVDAATAIQAVIDAGDTDGVLAGAVEVTTNDDPTPLALDLTVQQQSDFNVTTGYNIVDAATAIQAVIDAGDTDGVLAGAVEVTTNDDPTPLALDLTVQQHSDFNVTTAYNIDDVLSSILSENVGGSEVLNGVDQTLTASDLGVDGLQFMLTGLSDTEAGTAVDFTDAEVELTEAQVMTITGSGADQYSLGLNEADAITVTGVTSASFETVTDVLSDNDTVDLGEAVTLAAADYNDAFNTKGISATASNEITVTMENVAVAGTVANDTFAFTGAETGANITGFGQESSDDQISFTVSSLGRVMTGDTFEITADSVYFIDNATDAADASGSIQTAVGGGTITDTANEAFVVIADADSSAIYRWTGDAQGDGVTGDTLELIGTIDAALAFSDVGMA
ncbi:beta strand repeat-containing protein [Halomonas sp. MES3-P3E]|uniref:beta strand repeat-containing protein n=1 Tax=Halomonas sp. MES3-P3E TaxID=2058321 RepID=UPI000C33FC38|nr:hypothetical protein [Halomonas sp. MES3-P3E]PKG54780.1 hypothetical protein CXF87_01255 [Halomonas sp. MES3-P3E]